MMVGIYYNIKKMSKTTFSAFLTFTQDEASANYREGGGLENSERRAWTSL